MSEILASNGGPWGERSRSRRELIRGAALLLAGGCALAAGLYQLDGPRGTLTRSTFEPYVGQRFGLRSSAGGASGLELFKVRALRLGPSATTQADGDENFSLLFRGPLAEPLEQGVHELEKRPLGTLAIFLVPMLPEADARYYEGIFNRYVPN